MSLVGYSRVSTNDQNTEAQARALEELGCHPIFTDQGVSGTTSTRDGLDEALSYLREGDTLVVWRLDRLGRSVPHLLTLLDELKERGVGFKSIRDQIEVAPDGSNDNPMTRAMLTIMAAFSQLERDLISERTRAGLETARQRGRRGGRPTITVESPVVKRVVALRKAGEPIKDVAEALKLNESTVYKYLAMARKAGLID